MGVEVIGCTIMSACFRCMYRFLSTKLSALLLSIVHLLFCLLLSIVLGRYFPPLSPFPNPIASYLNIPISLSARALFYSPQHTCQPTAISLSCFVGMSSFLPFYSSFPEATPVYKYIYMYTTLENVHKSLLKISLTPLLFSSIFFLFLFLASYAALL